MILERLGGNLEDVVLQFLQRTHTCHLFLRLGVAEDEVAEPHVLLNELAQVHVHLLRVLIDEMEVLLLRLLLVHNLRTLQNQRHILVALADFAQQLQASLRITLLDVCQTTVHALQRESRVTDDTQHVVVIHLIPIDSLFVGRCQHHLRTSALALRGGVWVQSLGREILRLREDVVIQVRQHRRIEADVILDEQYHLHAGLLDVVFDVHLILNELDDAQDEVRVTQPAEYVVEDAHILVLDALRDTVRERRQHHARNVRGHPLYVACYGEGVVVGITRHTDHQVDVRRLQHVAGFLRRRHLRERGRIAHTQLHVFVEYLLVHASVVLQHEGIVRVCYYQHVEDASRHQVDERHVLQEEVVELLGDVTHNSLLMFT